MRAFVAGEADEAHLACLACSHCCLNGATGAEDALAWGLAEWRVPREALDQRAFELACILASRPPKAAARQKQLIDDVAFGNADEGLKREMLVQLELFDGPEYKALQAAR